MQFYRNPFPSKETRLRGRANPSAQTGCTSTRMAICVCADVPYLLGWLDVSIRKDIAIHTDVLQPHGWELASTWTWRFIHAITFQGCYTSSKSWTLKGPPSSFVCVSTPSTSLCYTKGIYAVAIVPLPVEYQVTRLELMCVEVQKTS